MSETEHVREQGEWTKIGMVTTGNGMLAIVPPYYAGAMNEWWHRDFLPKNEAQRRGLAPRVNPQFEEVRLHQTTWSVTNPDGYEDSEAALTFATPGNGGYDVEGRFGPLYGDDVSLLEVRIRFDAPLDEEDDDGSWASSPPLPKFDSSFGSLLFMALTTWCGVGRFKDRRLDDLLFDEYDPTADGDFSGFVMSAMYEPGPPEGQSWPPHENIQWQLMIIQCAINARDPERIARILDAEARFEAGQYTDGRYVDETGDEFELNDEERAELLAWPNEWRRVFGGETPAA